MFTRAQSKPELRRLEDLFRAGVVGDASDGDLLERFLRCQDEVGEAAFAALVERHCPMVYRVCKQSLRDPHDAEDATQATFLVLACHARAIRQRGSVSSWLFGVARRTSARIRMREAKRRRKEQDAAEQLASAMNTTSDSADPERYLELHAEVDRLPEKYRAPIVLCYFEGLSHEQAASRLRWPVGTVKTRLTRGRERLRARLEGRGGPFLLLVPADPIGAASADGLAEHLVHRIIESACRYPTSSIAGGMASASVLALAKEVTRMMFLSKWKTIAIALSGLLLIGLGGLGAAQQSGTEGKILRLAPDDDRKAAPGTEKPAAPGTLQLFGTTQYDPSTVTTVRLPLEGRVERVLVDLGSVIKKGDPLLEFFSSELASARSDYEIGLDQWRHDKKILDFSKPLADSNTLSRQALNDVEHNESQSRLKLRLAKDRLLIYGLTEAEIGQIPTDQGVQRARMTLRSRTSGVVVRRQVVPGNDYGTKDSLLTLAALDHLWVQALVAEADLPNVQLGQTIRVLFPHSPDRSVMAKVDFIDPMVQPDHTVLIRTTIPNPRGLLKEGAFVKLQLDTIAQSQPEGKHQEPSPRPHELSTSDRLDALERKLDQLLGDNGPRISNAQLLKRLDALERKLDQLLEMRKPKTP